MSGLITFVSRINSNGTSLNKTTLPKTSQSFYAMNLVFLTNLRPRQLFKLENRYNNIFIKIVGYKKYSSEANDLSYMDPLTRMKKFRGGVDPILKMGENSRVEPITTENYLRSVQTVYYDDNDNLHMWEPKIHIFSPDEIKKQEQLEDRKHRHERRGTRYP